MRDSVKVLGALILVVFVSAITAATVVLVAFAAAVGYVTLRPIPETTPIESPIVLSIPAVPGHRWLTPGTRFRYLVTDGRATARLETVQATASEDGSVMLDGPSPLRGSWTVKDRKVFRRSAKGALEELVLDLTIPAGGAFVSVVDSACPGVFRVTLNAKDSPWPNAPTFEMERISSRCSDSGITRVSFSNEAGFLSFTVSHIRGAVEYRLVDRTTSAPFRK